MGGLAQSGTVSINLNGHDLSFSFPVGVKRADVLLGPDMSNTRSAIDVFAGGAGRIAIHARNLTVSGGSALVAGIESGLDLPSTQAGDITLDATGAIQIGQSSLLINAVDLGAVGKGGNIRIVADSLKVEDESRLNTTLFGQGSAGNIIAAVKNQVELSNKSSFISRVAQKGEGNSGDIKLSAKFVKLTEGAQLLTETEGRGNAGSITIAAQDQVIFSGRSSDGEFLTTVLSGVAPFGEGRGGDINISANSLKLAEGAQLLASTFGVGDSGNIDIDIRNDVELSNQSGVFTSVEEYGEGNGGNLRVSANNLRVSSGSQLVSSTFAKGDAGNVIINVRDRVVFSGDAAAAISRVEKSGEGNGGDIRVFANSLEVSDGAQLVANTRGKGNAGSVIIDARDHVLFNRGNAFSSVEEGANGNGGDVKVFANSLDLINGSQIFAATRQGQGNAGNIFLGDEARPISSISISGVGPLGRSTALFGFTSSSYSGGSIRIVADRFRLFDGAVVDTRTFADGDSGSINIQANTIDILSGGQILAITEGGGSAKNIILNASKQLLISGTDPTYFQRLTQFTTNVAPVSPESGVYARSQASGKAGDVLITASRMTLDNQGRIDVQSASGNGGNITINIADLLLLRHNSQISATAGTAQKGGDGGNITINAPQGFIVGVLSENSDIRANAFTGSGGKVSITAQGIYGLKFQPKETPFSDITASSTFGVSGTVAINTLGIDPSRGLQQLSISLVDPSQQIAQTCIPRGAQRANSFTVTGAGGLPPSPNEPLQSDSVLADWVILDSGLANSQRRGAQLKVSHIPSSTDSQHSSSADSIPEAQGWVVDPNGAVYLVSRSTISSPTVRLPSLLYCQ